MIEEDYVSYDIAKLLKEKGFDIPCNYAYNNKAGYFEVNISNFNEVYCFRPSLAMATKWLREVNKIHITVYPYGEYSCDNYQFDIYKNGEYLMSKDEGYITNEQAIEVAIKYCLENLI